MDKLDGFFFWEKESIFWQDMTSRRNTLFSFLHIVKDKSVYSCLPYFWKENFK